MATNRGDDEAGAIESEIEAAVLELERVASAMPHAVRLAAAARVALAAREALSDDELEHAPASVVLALRRRGSEASSGAAIARELAAFVRSRLLGLGLKDHHDTRPIWRGRAGEAIDLLSSLDTTVIGAPQGAMRDLKERMRRALIAAAMHEGLHRDAPVRAYVRELLEAWREGAGHHARRVPD